MSGLLCQMVFQAARKCLAHLKTKIYGEKYEPRTIIGKEYQWVHSRKTHDDQPLAPRIIKKGSDGEDAILRGWNNYQSVTFGPFYSHLENETSKKGKEEAWKHVLRNSNDEGDENETLRLYVEAIRSVEEECRALYDGNVENPIASLSSDEFTRMMIIDGCFLLQIALFVLGGSKQLAHPIDDSTFGQPGNKSLIRAALSSMFVVGNQIPMLVLKMLMQQTFFVNVFNQGIWQQPLELERRVLFELILVPMLNIRKGTLFIRTSWLHNNRLFGFFGFFSRSWPLPLSIFIWYSKLEQCVKSITCYILVKRIYPILFNGMPAPQEANDLLHGLWLFTTGLTSCNEDNKDFEEDTETIIHGNSSKCYYDVLRPSVRSATELKEARIDFVYNEVTGIKGIRFERVILNAFLVLPRITIDADQIEMLCNLIRYEVTQERDESRWKLCAYLQLMREIVRTPEDAKLLVSNGVILVDPNEEEKLPKFFQGLPIPEMKANRSLSRVRNQLKNYTHPSMFKKVSEVLSIVNLLTLIQTVYAILSFHLRK